MFGVTFYSEFPIQHLKCEIHQTLQAASHSKWRIDQQMEKISRFHSTKSTRFLESLIITLCGILFPGPCCYDIADKAQSNLNND